MGGGRNPLVGDSDSLEDLSSKQSWSIEESDWSGLERSEKESSNLYSEFEYGRMDSSLSPTCPYGQKLKTLQWVKERLNKVQHSAEFEEVQNEIVTEDNCSKALKGLTGTLFEDGNSEKVEVEAESKQFKDAICDHEVNFEMENQHRELSPAGKQEFKNCQEDVFDLEDITSKQLPFLENGSREKRRRAEICRKIIQKNGILKLRSARIEDEKERLLRYIPGVWLIETGGVNIYDHKIPTVTTLLLVGPKGAGKSTLINNILRVLSNGNERLDRAQVSYKSSAESGSYFLQEYMCPGHSKSFCVFDSRGLSANVTEDLPLLQNWIKNGIRHGEMVIRSSDDNTVRISMEQKARDRHYKFSKIRKVNFVIFVVNALSIQQIMDSMDTLACDTLVKLFSCPYLSFKDDKPVVIMTHGDELADSDRLRSRVFLGELFGVSAVNQVFDISDDSNPATDMALLDMLEFCLQHADRNLPYKEKDLVHQLGSLLKLPIRVAQWPSKIAMGEELKYSAILVGLSIFLWHQFLSSAGSKSDGLEWHQIRHLWLG